MVSRAGPALECEQVVFSRNAADVERFRGASERRRVLAKAGVRSIFQGFDARGAEPERGGMVGPGRFLRPDEGVRASREERCEAQQLFDGGAVESWRMGA